MNWMKNWEQAQAEAEDTRLKKEPDPVRSRGDLEHVEKLISDDILFMYNEIAHGNFEIARKTLEECRERYTSTNAGLALQLDDIQNILKIKDNSAGVGEQLDLPL